MKKFTLAIVLFLLLATLFSGCGQQSTSDDTPANESSSQNEDEESTDFSNREFTEQTVAEYFTHISETYYRTYLLAGRDIFIEDWTYNFKYTNLLREENIVPGSELHNYLSNSELEEYTEILASYDGPDFSGENIEDSYFRIQYADEMQAGFDELWGRNSIDIKEILSTREEYDTMYFSKDGILINPHYPADEEYEMIPYYDITGIEIDGDTATVISKRIAVTGSAYFSEYGYAIDNTDNRLIGDVVEKDWSVKNKNASFDETVSQLGIDKSTLGKFEFTIRNTPDGPVVDDIEKTGADYSLRGLVTPDQILEYAQHCEVDADVGLNLRYGPTTEYDVVTLLPDQLRISELGYSDNNAEWFFVGATLDGTEYFGWVNRDFIEFYGGMAKPVIYLYPEEAMDVSVEVAFSNGGFTCTYPEYRNGWNVFAYPDGRVIDNADGLEYSYLYWEGEGNVDYDMSRGFVVKGEDTAAFLREKLSYMGLTPREYNEFIVYWLPLMHNNKYNLITFQTTAYTDNVQLNVTPKPDSMLRVYMVYQPLDEYRFVPEPELDQFNREGFSVIEWGGTER